VSYYQLLNTERSEVSTVMKIQVVMFWVVTPCSDMKFTLKMEAATFSETLVSYRITTHSRKNPGDRDLNSQ